jgi:hypothetical protein
MATGMPQDLHLPGDDDLTEGIGGNRGVDSDPTSEPVVELCIFLYDD